MINIDLLPPEIKDEIKQSKMNKQILGFAVKMFLILLAYVILMGAYYFWFTNTLNAVTQRYTQEDKEVSKYGQVEEEAKKVADRLESVKKIEANTNHWSGAIGEIAKVVPSGVSLLSIDIKSVKNNRNQITGEAKSKTGVAALRDSMEKSEYFEFVDIESSITTEDKTAGNEYENFTLSFSLEKGALE